MEISHLITGNQVLEMLAHMDVYGGLNILNIIYLNMFAALIMKWSTLY